MELSQTNSYAKQVIDSWAEAEWFTSRSQVAESITITAFKVTGETSTDDLFPAPHATTRPDIPLHALSMLEDLCRDDLQALGFPSVLGMALFTPGLTENAHA